MKRVILAPDSFKGTMSAAQVCQILEGEIKRLAPDVELISIPMSDGGEGMAQSYVSLLGGSLHSQTVSGPAGKPVEAQYGLLPDGRVVMEMAACAGLPLMEGRLDPLNASTYGLGELICHVANSGCKRLLMGLGGSASNDCGIGMAAALGYRFLDGSGRELEALARNLGAVEDIVPPEKLPDMEICAACDVDNPLCGPRGAALVFGPQKGLKPREAAAHDTAMEHFAGLLKEKLGRDVKDVPGAGAAGGLGAGMLAFLNARLQPGIELLLDSADFDSLLDSADLVITGEGRLDGQSLAGKVPYGVARRCAAKAVKCIAICGALGPGAEELLKHGLSAYYAVTDGSRSFAEIKASCREELARAAAKLLPEYL